MNKAINTSELKPAVTTGPLPSSRKIFVTPDEAPDVRVPLREIMLSKGAGEPNLPVYDTSGPYTDPEVTIDVNAGLSRGRIAWVKERGGVEEYQGRDIKPEDNGNVGASHAAKSFNAHHKPLRGVGDHMITQLEFARAGIITKEMIYVATRENLGRDVVGRGRSRQDGMGDPLGRRHRDGPLDRAQHPHHPRMDPAQRADPDRHRADLSGAGEMRRRSGQADVGALQGHADRTVRTGR